MRTSRLHDDLTLRRSREREAYHKRSLRHRYLPSTSCLREMTANEGVAKEAPTLWVYCDGRRDAAGLHPRLPSEAHAMGFSEKVGWECHKSGIFHSIYYKDYKQN